MSEMKPVYFWQMGDIALARICKKVYSKVQVVKDENGLFFDDKGITPDGESIKVEEELCYYVEILHSKDRLWLPYTSMFLAERSRPFYGTEAKKPKQEQPTVKKPRLSKKLMEDVSELNDDSYKDSDDDSDLDEENEFDSSDNASDLDEENEFDLSDNASDLDEENKVLSSDDESDLDKKNKVGSSEDEDGSSDDESEKYRFKQYVNSYRDLLFDKLYEKAKAEHDEKTLHYLHNVNASTEDKIAMLLGDKLTETQVANYVYHCWKYTNEDNNCNFKEGETDSDDISDESLESDDSENVPVHINWCLVCSESDDLIECTNCPAAFHVHCKKDWFLSITHRKNPPRLQSSYPVKAFVENKKASLCPTCMWGPKVGYNDIVWHKLNSFSWWPARVLTPGSVPPCLQSTAHEQHEWPLRYYGTLNHAWADDSHMCLFLPRQTVSLTVRSEMLRKALLDAADDYISVYLT